MNCFNSEELNFGGDRDTNSGGNNNSNTNINIGNNNSNTYTFPTNISQKKRQRLSVNKFFIDAGEYVLA